MQVIQYEDKHAAIWDDFVLNASANGTVFHTRNFLNYHPKGRFRDSSILIYETQELVGVFAAAKQEDGSYFSHPGTSCGGPVIHKDCFKIAKIVEMSERIREYYQKPIGMRLCERFLLSRGNAPILYEFSKSCEVRFELSAYKELETGSIADTIPRSSSRSAVRSIFRQHDRFQLADAQQDFAGFYQVLTENLNKHCAAPTHSKDELLSLANLLMQDQQLILWRDELGEIGAGVWMIRASDLAWHAQYIARNSECRVNGIVEATLIKCMEFARERGARCFSLGISTENHGSRLNIGLSTFKEKLGCAFENRFLLLPKA